MKSNTMLVAAAGVVGLTGLTALFLGALSGTSETDELPVWTPPETAIMKMDKATFLQRMKPIALEIEQTTGLSHLFIIAQAAVESAWGCSTPGNMLFGRKWTQALPVGRRQLLRTWEERLSPGELQKFRQGVGGRAYLGPETRGGRAGHLVRDWFVKYDSWDHCVREQAAFLRRRWPTAFGVSPELAAEVVAGDHGGPRYATDARYAAKLKRVIARVRAMEQSA